MNIADYLKTSIPTWPNWINLILYKCNFLGEQVYGGTYKRILQNMEITNPEIQLFDTVNNAIKNVPYYRSRYKGLHINSIADFENNIEFIDKNEVMNHWDEFLIDGINMNECVSGTTGGTSGRPLKLILPQNRYAHSLAFWHKELKWFGWNYDARAVIRNHHLPTERGYMINPVLKEFIFDAFRMSPDYAKYVHSILKKYNIKYIHAYPSGAYQFLKLCHAQNLDLSFIKLCILSSEGVTEEQRYFIENELGIKIYSFYNHSEKLVMAGNCPNSKFYHIEENYGYCELIDSNSRVIKECGKLGEIVGTTFINKYMPLIRYKTGDYSSYVNNGCAIHGNSLRYLDTVQGRWDKSLIYKSDGSTTTTTALNLHGKIYEHIDGLQYIQESAGELVVLIIPNNKYNEQDTEILYSHIRKALGDNSKIHIKFVDKLIYQQNGKFLPLISKIKI